MTGLSSLPCFPPTQDCAVPSLCAPVRVRPMPSRSVEIVRRKPCPAAVSCAYKMNFKAFWICRDDVVVAMFLAYVGLGAPPPSAV